MSQALNPVINKFILAFALMLFFQIEFATGRQNAIVLPDHPEWNFKVSIEPNLVTEPCITKQPEKLFLISDVEGEFEGFKNLLIAGKVIDAKYNWTFGKGHMIICGICLTGAMKCLNAFG